MKRIKLTQGKFALVDDEDFEWLSQWKWRYSSYGYATRYAYLGKIRKGKYIYKTLSMHRLILNTPKNLETDHIDGNKLNNQKNNLRIATRRQNSQNRFNSKRKNSKLPMGVSSHRSGIWRSRITINGKEVHLGDYDTVKEAGIAYNHSALKYFGEFANFNDIPDWQKIYPIRHKYYLNRRRKNNTSGVVGVYYHKSKKRWRARITFNQERIYLGSFIDKFDAIKIYNQAVKKYFGYSINK